MIKTEKFTNSLQARYDDLIRDPVKWGIMRNLAYASIRGDIEKIVKQTNENSAETFINAEDLIQNLKSDRINQYIDAGKLTQNITLTDKSQLNQILFNTDVEQNIRVIERKSIVNNIERLVSSSLSLFLNNKYALITYRPTGIIKYNNVSFNQLDVMYNYILEHYIQKLETDATTNLEGKQNSRGQVYRFLKYDIVAPNYKEAFDSNVNHLIYEFTYPKKNNKSGFIIMIIINLEKYGIKNELGNPIRFKDNSFGTLISDREKLNESIGRELSEEEYEKGIGNLVRIIDSDDKKIVERNILVEKKGKKKIKTEQINKLRFNEIGLENKKDKAINLLFGFKDK